EPAGHREHAGTGTREDRGELGAAAVAGSFSEARSPVHGTHSAGRGRRSSPRDGRISPLGVMDPVTNPGDDATTRKRLTTSPRLAPGQFPPPRHPPADAPVEPSRLT